MRQSQDGPDPTGLAFEWVSRILAVVVEMVLPGVGGGWLDARLQTAPLCTLLGFGLGLTVGIWHLLLMTKKPKGPDTNQDRGDNQNGGEAKGGRGD